MIDVLPTLRPIPLWAIFMFGVALVSGCHPSAEPSATLGREESLAKARGLREAGDLVEAERLLRASLLEKGAPAAGPGDGGDESLRAALHFELGSVLMDQERPTLAVWRFLRAKRDPALRLESTLAIAHAHLRSANGHEAARWATELINEVPNHVESRIVRARGLMAIRKEERALEDFDWVLGHDPDNLVVLRGRFTALRALGRYAEAREALGPVRAVSLRQPAAKRLGEGALCLAEATLFVDEGKTDVANRAYARCASRSPEDDAVLRTVARYFVGLGEFAEAISLLRAAERAVPASRTATVLLADALRQAGRPGEAAVHLEEVAARLDDPLRWMDLADHALAVGDAQAARRAADFGIAGLVGADLDRPEVSFEAVPQDGLFSYADLLAQTGGIDRARRVAAQLDEPVHRELIEARLLLETGQPEAALAAYDLALNRWPWNAGARYLAAQAAMQAGEFGRAMDHYQESLRADQKATDAGWVLARLELARGRPGAALQSLEYHLLGHPEDVETFRLFGRIASRIVATADGPRAAVLEKAKHARAMLAALPGQRAAAIADHAFLVAASEGADAGLRLLDAKRVSDLSEVDSGLDLDLDLPENAAALAVWVELMAAAGRESEVMGRLESLCATACAPAQGALYGRQLERLGRATEAIQIFEGVAKEAPTDAESLADWAALLADAGLAQEALVLFDRSAGVRPAPATELRAAELAMQLEGVGAAIARVEGTLERFPWSGAAAARLANLMRSRSALGPADGKDPREGADLSSSDLEQIRRLERRGALFSFDLLAAPRVREVSQP